MYVVVLNGCLLWIFVCGKNPIIGVEMCGFTSLTRTWIFLLSLTPFFIGHNSKRTLLSVPLGGRRRSEPGTLNHSVVSRMKFIRLWHIRRPEPVRAFRYGHNKPDAFARLTRLRNDDIGD